MEAFGYANEDELLNESELFESLAFFDFNAKQGLIIIDRHLYCRILI